MTIEASTARRRTRAVPAAVSVPELRAALEGALEPGETVRWFARAGGKAYLRSITPLWARVVFQGGAALGLLQLLVVANQPAVFEQGFGAMPSGLVGLGVFLVCVVPALLVVRRDHVAQQRFYALTERRLLEVVTASRPPTVRSFDRALLAQARRARGDDEAITITSERDPELVLHGLRDVAAFDAALTALDAANVA